MKIMILTSSIELRRILSNLETTDLDIQYSHSIDHIIQEANHCKFDVIMVDFDYRADPLFPKLMLLYRRSICYYVEDLLNTEVNLDAFKDETIIHAKTPSLVYQGWSKLYQCNNAGVPSATIQEQVDDLQEWVDEASVQFDILGKRIEAVEPKTTKDTPSKWNIVKSWRTYGPKEWLLGMASFIVAMKVVAPFIKETALALWDLAIKLFNFFLT